MTDVDMTLIAKISDLKKDVSKCEDDIEQVEFFIEYLQCGSDYDRDLVEKLMEQSVRYFSKLDKLNKELWGAQAIEFTRYAAEQARAAWDAACRK